MEEFGAHCSETVAAARGKEWLPGSCREELHPGRLAKSQKLRGTATREMGSQGLKGVESRRHIRPITQGIWEDTSSCRDCPVDQEL